MASRKELDEIVILGVNLGRERTQRWSPEATEKEEPAKVFGEKTDPRFLCCSDCGSWDRIPLIAPRNAEATSPSLRV